MVQTKIVILGGGFAGLRTVLNLAKRFQNNSEYSITLINERDYFLFTPNLFEVACAPQEFSSMRQLKKSICLPFSQILKKVKVRFLKGQALSINTIKKQVFLNGKIIDYDYLVLALGSRSEFFNISGAEEHSLTLKNLKDALLIRHRLEFLVAEHAQDAIKKNLRIMIAGGGYTAVELAGELHSTLDILCWKYNYLRQRLKIDIIEARNMLMPGFDKQLSQDTYVRLKKLGVTVNFLSPIEKVEKNFVTLGTKERLAFDMLIWAAGVKANNIAGTEHLEKNWRGQIITDHFLRAKSKEDIFVVGDIAEVLDHTGRPAPSSAQDAMDQAKYIAYALPSLLKNKRPLKIFRPNKHGFIVNVGGKWAIMSHKDIYLKGFLAFLVDKFAHFRFYSGLVGVKKALKFIFTEVELYGRND